MPLDLKATLLKQAIVKTINNSVRLQYRLYDLNNQSMRDHDIEEIWQIDQDPEVMRFLTKGVITSRDVMQSIFIPRINSYTDTENGYGMWRVALASDNTCIGEIIARPMNFFTDSPHLHDIELGWRFIRKYWGNGYATEAAAHLMQEISKKPEVKHFSAMADPKNIASTQVMQKLGMQFVEHVVHKDPLGDTPVDIYRIDL